MNDERRIVNDGVGKRKFVCGLCRYIGEAASYLLCRGGATCPLLLIYYLRESVLSVDNKE